MISSIPLEISTAEIHKLSKCLSNAGWNSRWTNISTRLDLPKINLSTISSVHPKNSAKSLSLIKKPLINLKPLKIDTNKPSISNKKLQMIKTLSKSSFCIPQKKKNLSKDCTKIEKIWSIADKELKLSTIFKNKIIKSKNVPSSHC